MRLFEDFTVKIVLTYLLTYYKEPRNTQNAALPIHLFYNHFIKSHIVFINYVY